MTLPVSIRTTLMRRTKARTFLIGSHELDTCLSAFDENHILQLESDCQRRRIIEEASIPSAAPARARRIFGFLIEVAVQDSGGFVLPPLLRCRAGISDSALVIGTGKAFEIWSPHLALDGDDPDLRELTTFLLQIPQAA